MNKQEVCLLGRSVSTPEVKKSKDDTAYSEVSIAVNWDSKNKKGKKEEKVTYYRVLVFGKRAEKSKNIKKGRLLYAKGRLEVDPYVSDKGEGRVSLTVIAREFYVLDSKIFK